MDRLQDALDYIEANLTGELSLAAVAGAACMSPFHFARTFRAQTGWTVMAYVQARRLTAAADRLLTGGDRLLDLAFAYGFESQATFTRAFKRKFAVPPGSLRRHSTDDWRILRTLPLVLDDRRIDGDTDMHEPKFIDLPAFQAAGLKGRFDHSTRRKIGDLWSRFNNLPHPLPGTKQDAAYGICSPPEAADGSFDYIAAVAVEDAAALPDDLVVIDIPAQHYAVFTHRIASDNISDGIEPIMQFIWKDWLPNSGYRYANTPDFELYGPRFDVETLSGDIDIYVPVEPDD